MAAMETRVACLLADGFEDSEFKVPYERLRESGFDVEILSTKPAGAVLHGALGKVKARVDLGIEDADPERYVAVLIPGGYSPDHLRNDSRVIEFVIDFDALKRPIGAVCHGPQILLTARLVAGRTLTAWSTVQGDLEAAGAIVKNQPVVVDGNWISSRKPDDLDAFCAKFIEEIGEWVIRRSAAAAQEPIIEH